jgi:phytoene dehydrogenase-like protein
VVLESGEEIEAHGSVESRSQAHVPAPAGRRGPGRRVRRAIRNFRIEGTSCKINLALNGCRSSRAIPARPAASQGHDAHLPSIEYVERAWDDAKYGRASERPLLELTIPRCTTLARAARQAHHGIFLQYAPYTCGKARGTNCASRSAIA